QMQFGHPGSSSSLDEAIVGVSADNRFLLSKENSQLILWDAHSLRLLKRFKFKDEIKTASFTENGLIVVSETASTPFIMEYNFETSEITELAVQNQHEMLSYEQVFIGANGEYYLYEQNPYAFYWLKIDKNTGNIIDRFHSDSFIKSSSRAFLRNNLLYFTGNGFLNTFNIESKQFNKHRLLKDVLALQEFNNLLYLLTSNGLVEYDPDQHTVTNRWAGSFKGSIEDFRPNFSTQMFIIKKYGEDKSDYELWRWRLTNNSTELLNSWSFIYMDTPYPISGNRLLWSIDIQPLTSSIGVKEPPDTPDQYIPVSLDFKNDRLATSHAIYSLSEANLVSGYTENMAFFMSRDSIIYLENEFLTSKFFFVKKSLLTQQVERTELSKEAVHLDFLDYSPQSKVAATKDMAKLDIWDTQTGKHLGKFDNGGYPTIRSVTFNESGDELLVNITAKISQHEIWHSSYPFRKFKKLPFFAENAIFSHHKDSLLVDKTLLNIHTGKSKQLYNYSPSYETYRVYDQKNHQLITGHENGEINIWSLNDVNEKWNIQSHSAPIAKMKADGCKLASFSEDGHYSIIDLCKKESLVSLYPRKQGILLKDLSQFSYVWLTPEGYYKASKNATDIVHFVKGFKAYSFDQFDLWYNRPDKVIEKLGMGDSLVQESYKKAYIKRLNKMKLSKTEINRYLNGDFQLNLSAPEVIIPDSLRYIQTNKAAILLTVGINP
ncbi:MAG: hypothetical protein ABFS32_23155, partial [Bacteroidota bacterium]